MTDSECDCTAERTSSGAGGPINVPTDETSTVSLGSTADWQCQPHLLHLNTHCVMFWWEPTSQTSCGVRERARMWEKTRFVSAGDKTLQRGRWEIWSLRHWKCTLINSRNILEQHRVRTGELSRTLHNIIIVFQHKAEIRKCWTQGHAVFSLIW